MQLDEKEREMKLPKAAEVVTEIESLPDSGRGTEKEGKYVKVQKRQHFGYSLWKRMGPAVSPSGGSTWLFVSLSGHGNSQMGGT